MQITSESFVIAICVVAALAIVAVPVLWDRWTWRKTFRSVTVLLAAVLALFAAGVFVNAQGDFFPTWTSLVGGDSSGLAAGQAGVQGDLGHTRGRSAVTASLRRYAALTRDGNGVVVRQDLAGPASHISRPGAVYLPAAYFRRAYADVDFPVLELLSGSPGDPAGELRKLAFAQYLDQEIRARRMPPTIAVIPSTNPSSLHDDECVNAVHGDADDTYLTTDIRNDMIRNFRVRTDRNAWSLMGYSTGGYCAVNLVVRHPLYYSTATSFSGYFYPITDYTTGDLYHGDAKVQQSNFPLLTLRKASVQPATSFFLVAGSLEHGPPAQLRTLLGELRAPASGVGLIVPNGGHDWAPWRQELPIALDWVGQRFGGPLAAPLRPDHGETVIVASGIARGMATTLAGGKVTLKPELPRHRPSVVEKANAHVDRGPVASTTVKRSTSSTSQTRTRAEGLTRPHR